MKAEEIRGMTDGALQEELDKARRELLELRCQVALGEEVRPHQLKELRRDIARIRTIQKDRARAASAEKAGSTA